MRKIIAAFLCVFLLASMLPSAGAAESKASGGADNPIAGIELGENAQRQPLVTLTYSDISEKNITISYFRTQNMTKGMGGCSATFSGIAQTDDGDYWMTLFFENESSFWIGVVDPYSEDWVMHYSRKTAPSAWFRVWMASVLDGEAIAAKCGETTNYNGTNADITDLVNIALCRELDAQGALPTQDYTVSGENLRALMKKTYGAEPDLDALNGYDDGNDTYTLASCNALEHPPVLDGSIRYEDGKWYTECVTGEWAVNAVYGADITIAEYNVTAKKEILFGDVDGSGEIDSLDGLLLMRFLNGWDVTIPDPDAMDVNHDGSVNSLDGLLLMRYLNGWDVRLGGNEELCLTSLTVDGGSTLNFQPDTKEYTVQIPAGRPRIPKVSATADDAEVTIYQAVIPDQENTGEAKILLSKGSNTAEYTVKFVKDQALGYRLQYKDEIVFQPNYTLKAGESFQFLSSDSAKLAVSGNGRVQARDLSDTPVTVTAYVGGRQVDALTVDKIVKAPVNVFLIMGQSNAYGWHDAPPAYSDYYAYANTQKAISDRPDAGTCFCDDVQNSYDEYTFSGMYDLSAGRSGFSPALGKEWYAETGEKCLMLQSAIGSTPLETWTPDPELKFFGLDCYAITVERFNYYKAQFAAENSKFEMNRVYAFWLQGETGEEFVYDPGEFKWETKNGIPNYPYHGDWRPAEDPSQLMTSRTYSEYFNSMYQALVKDVGLEFIGILPARAMTSVSSAGNIAEQQLIDLVPTRAAQFALNYTENGNIHFVTLKTEIGRMESYPDHSAEGWGFMGCNNIHYNQLGYNALGKDAAENAVAMFSGKSDRTATELRLLDQNGRAGLNDGDTITIRAGETYQVSAVVLPLYAENTALQFRVEDSSVCAVDAFGMLTAGSNARAAGKSTTLTVTNGELTKVLNIKITNGHTIVTDQGKAPTCTQPGLTEGQHCSECGKVFAVQKEIPAAGHKYVDTVVQPTTVTRGYTEHKCSVCGTSYRDTYTEVIPYQYDEETLRSLGLGFVLQSRSDTEISKGITYSEMNYKDRNGVSHVAYAVIAAPGTVSLELGFPGAAQGLNGLDTVYNQTKAARDVLGKDVIASVNADLFTSSKPNGTTIYNGELLRQDSVGYQGFALMKDGTFRFSNNATEFVSQKQNIKFSCGGRYLVMKDGEIYNNGTADSFCSEHHPRTAFGVRKDGTMIFLVVDGRQSGYSDGATLLDLSVIFVHLGVYDAINLDGGGSTNLFLKDSATGDFTLKNRPSEKNRKVVNILYFAKK